jgi:hypothetical protein
MNKNLHNIDKLFSRVLKDHKENPPKNIWGQIENDLNRKDAEMYKAKYRSLQRTLHCIILICTCLLLSAVLQFVPTGSAKTELDNRVYSKDNLDTINNDLTKKSNSISNKSFKQSLDYVAQSEVKRAGQSHINSISPDGALNFSNKNKSIIGVPQPGIGSLSLNNYPGFLLPDSAKNRSAFTQLQIKSSDNSKQGQTKQDHFYILMNALKESDC